MTGDQQPNDSNRNLAQRLDINFALQAAGLGVWEIDPLTNQVLWDDRCCELFGLANTNSLSYQQALQPIHPEDRDRVDQAVRWAMNPQSGGNYDVTHRTMGAQDGRLRWVRFTGRSYFTDSGEVVRFAGVVQEITESVLARKQVAETDRQLQSMIEQAPVAIALFSGHDMVFQVCNEGMLSIIGKDKSVIGQPLAEAVPELKGQGFVELQQQVYRTGETVFGTGVPAKLESNGVLQEAYYDYTYSPLRDPSGAVTGVMVLATNVTQQVRARKLIEASEGRLRKLVMQAPIGTCILNAADLVCEIVNDSFVELAGKPYEDIIGKNYWIPFAEAEPYYGTALQGVVKAGKTFYANEVELMLIRHGQEETIYVTFVYEPLKDDRGQVQKVAVWVLENTHQVIERRKIEELVAERTQELATANEELAATNEELAAHNEEYAAINEELEESNQLLFRSNENLQQFAYVASHDLQEPLRKIQSFGDLLSNQYGQQLGEGVVYLGRMQTAALRMSTLIKDLLSFSRIATQRDTSDPIALATVVQMVLADLDLAITDTGAIIEVDELPTIEGDRSQLEQLFHNLLSNAFKFHKPEVAPRVQVRSNWLAADHLPEGIRPTRKAIAYYRIDVIDNGVGFDEKYLDRIFAVFQRLHGKNQYAGTGIGLAICEKVVANHGGAITASSTPGQGATFSVYLPVY